MNNGFCPLLSIGSQHTLHLAVRELEQDGGSAVLSCPASIRFKTSTRFCSWVFNVSISFIDDIFTEHLSYDNITEH